MDAYNCNRRVELRLRPTHTTLRMTERYSHLAPGHKVAQMEKFDAFMNKKIPGLELQIRATSEKLS